jgi:hypothetical protein
VVLAGAAQIIITSTELLLIVNSVVTDRLGCANHNADRVIPWVKLPRQNWRDHPHSDSIVVQSAKGLTIVPCCSVLLESRQATAKGLCSDQKAR